MAKNSGLTGLDLEISKMSKKKQEAYAKLFVDANTQANMGAAPKARKGAKKK